MQVTRAQFLMGLAGAALAGVPSPTPAAPEVSPLMRLRGRLVFHRYTSYEAGDSRLYLYDFGQSTLRRLGDDWEIANAMNAAFSPDGSALVFMAQPARHQGGDSWRIYLWQVDSGRLPEDLTANSEARNEDPKFSPDGKSIVFKQDGRIKFMDLSGHVLTELSAQNGEEQSMPYVLPDGRHIVYAQGDGPGMKIVYCGLDGASARDLSAEAGVQCYYPIPWGDRRVLFTRWESAGNRNDQIYCADVPTGRLQRMPFDLPDQNTSDPFPAGDRYIFFSGTRPESLGGYDLYLGDAMTGRTWSLSALGVNSALDELGACYSERRG